MNTNFTLNFSFNKEPISTFNLIKNKICELENIKTLETPNIENKQIHDLGDGYRISNSFNRLSICSFFYSPFNDDCGIKSLSNILDNGFYDDESKFHILRIYSKIKKCYNIFSRIARTSKWNKMKKYDNNYDLCMNELSNYKSSTLLEIAEDNVRYIFRISDMIKIFNNALTNNYEMFAEPQPIKNPYTNKEISNHNLYNIYYTIKYSNMNMPILVHMFYLSSFDIDDFILNNEEKVRDMSIQSYMKGLNGKKLNKIIREMFTQYRYSFRLKVHDDFPMEKLNEIFLPFVKLYIQIKYTLSRIKKTSFSCKLKNKLKLFCKHAPLFGRKIIRLHNKKKRYFFNSDCKTFDELEIVDDERPTPGPGPGIIPYDTEEDSDSDSDSDSDNETAENNESNNQASNNQENNNQESNNQQNTNNANTPTNTQIIVNLNENTSRVEWFTANQFINNINNSNIMNDFSTIQYINDPISLYNYDNTIDNAMSDDMSDDMDDNDTEVSDDEEEIRPFPYNYDSH